MLMLLLAANVARFSLTRGVGALAQTAPRTRIASAVRASAMHSVPARVVHEPLFRRTRPLCVVSDSVAVLTGEALDEAISAQGLAVRALKDATAPKEEVDAAVGRLLELKAMLPAPGPVELPTNDKSPHLLRVRHTSAHIMAMAVQRLYPKTQVTIGPWIDNGFYYDFDSPEQFSTADLKKIEKEMAKIIRKKLPLRREEVTREEARARIEKLGEPYKLELLDAIKTEPITIYHVGDEWWDLCAGPHVANTGDIDTKALSLESVAGAYWRGDEKRAMLQRIYGTAWESKEQLVEYQRRTAEAKRRDHRVLGKKLNLFSIQQEAGGGLVFWHPKGAGIRRRIEDYWKDVHVEAGYELLYTPHVANLDLWKTSGHFDFYKDGMFDQMSVEDEQYQIKPMNCPFHVLVLSKFGFDKYVINLSTRPEKSVGSDEIWDKATRSLVEALERKGWAYEVDEGGGAFYGPKIDIKINDAIGRTWQCSTIQCDFNLPERFEMEYVDKEGQRQVPIMVHRAIFGSIERFFGILTENTAGDFPYWLAPVQLRLLPVVGEAEAFCAKVVADAKRLGLRAEVDKSGERLGKLIRNSEMQRIPVMAVVGKSEMESGKLSLRTRYGGSLGELSIEEALAVMAKANAQNVEPNDILGIEVDMTQRAESEE
ncbi:hypothetical protein T492DRAFT_1039453 [Pavlovales sp. CCMP2436]|nr:hypothetical protein T492DRAFT_1039453 [Pavlovales sp. CCMP2436]